MVRDRLEIARRHVFHLINKNEFSNYDDHLSFLISLFFPLFFLLVSRANVR